MFIPVYFVLSSLNGRWLSLNKSYYKRVTDLRVVSRLARPFSFSRIKFDYIRIYALPSTNSCGRFGRSETFDAQVEHLVSIRNFYSTLSRFNIHSRYFGSLLGGYWADIPTTSCTLYLEFSMQLTRYLVYYFFTLRLFFNYECPQDIIHCIVWHSVQEKSNFCSLL